MSAAHCRKNSKNFITSEVGAKVTGRKHHLCSADSKCFLAIRVSSWSLLKQEHDQHNEIQILFYCWDEMVPLSSKSIQFLNDSIGTEQILCFWNMQIIKWFQSTTGKQSQPTVLRVGWDLHHAVLYYLHIYLGWISIMI